MEVNFVLSWIEFWVIGEVCKIGGFTNLQNHFETHTKNFIKFFKIKKSRTKGSFQNQGPDDTSQNQFIN
jgi:hypothetical protein